MKKEINRRRDIMKKGILKGIMIVVLLLITGTVFALSGLLPKKNESKKTVEIEKEEVVANRKNTNTKDKNKNLQISKKKRKYPEDGVIITSDASSEAEKIEFVQKVVLDLKWGEGPYNISSPREANYEQGEYLFIMKVDKNENLFILDEKLNVIKIYSKNGKFLKQIKCQEKIYPTFELDESGNPYYSYSINSNKVKIIKYSKDGDLIDFSVSTHQKLKEKREKWNNRELRSRNKNKKELEQALNSQILMELNNGYLIGWWKNAITVFNEQDKRIFSREAQPSLNYLDYNQKRLIFTCDGFQTSINGSIYFSEPSNEGIKVIKWEMKK